MSSPSRRDSSHAVAATRRSPKIERVPSIPPLAQRIAAVTSEPAARPAPAPAAPSAPNVIPFVKPRAIAAIAAADPAALVTGAPRAAAAVRSVRSGRPEPELSHAGYVPSGWTPPRGVNAIAQGERARATTRPPTAPAFAPPIASARPATQMPVAEPPPLPPPPAAPAAPVAPLFAAPSAPIVVATAAPAATPSDAYPVLRHGTAGAPTAAPAPAIPPRWSEYAALGLGPPAASSQRAAKLIVSAYRLLGFGILTVIVVVLVGYIATTAFYYFSDSWIAPMAVSPTDEKVVTLQAQLAEQQNARDRIADELHQAERAIAAQQTFQAEFAHAIRSDLEGRRLALGRVRALASSAAQTRVSIRNQNAAYASASRRRMAEEYAAGLIDRSALLSGRYQLAQISSSNLSLAERQAEFETRAAELEAQTRSLDAILANAGGPAGTPLSYEVLRIKQEYEASRLDLAKSIEARDTLRAALERQDKIVQALRQSAYLRAVADGASVAFVPYGNLESVAKGAELYACRLGMLFCYRVGAVQDVLPGEVQFKHPHRDQNLRGRLVLLELDEGEADAAADDVLFAGGRPLLL